MTSEPPSDPAELARELAQVQDRDAAYRLKVAADFLVLQRQLVDQRTRIDELSDELGRRNTYIHELHGTRQEWEQREQQLHDDIAHFVQRLAEATDEAERLREQLERVRNSWGWSLLAPLRQLQKWRQRAAPARTIQVGPASADFVYYLKMSPFRRFRERTFTLRGWAFPHDGRAVTAVRARVDQQEFLGVHGLEEPDVVAQYAPANNPHPGFEVTFATPPGRHLLSLEAQLEHRVWVCILRTPFWCDLPPASP
jgi:hypothetical protein